MSRERIGSAFAAAGLLCVLLVPMLVDAAAPVLFKAPFYQSPVRGEADDLVLIPGSGFAADDVVVYRRLSNTTAPLVPPTAVPPASTDVEGVLEVVSTSGVPNALTVRLPSQVSGDTSYVLWVRNSQDQWSNGIRINDARPLWVTPAIAYSTASLASLPRELKVVGRNLHPASGAVTQVRLVGPQSFTFTAINDGNPATAIERYVARVALPAYLPPGNYAVKVRRDGASWLSLSGQQLVVYDDPVEPGQFPVATQGCAPDDGVDDSSCILNAIAAAKVAGGGTVTFGPGTWDLINSSTPGIVWGEGIVVAPGVNLQGAGASLTTLVRHDAWADRVSPARTEATWTLQGRNRVQGIRFKDARIYAPADAGVSLLKLGKRYDRVGAGEPASVEDVTITQNIFDRAQIAIVDGGLPIRHLFLTYNRIGGYRGGTFLGGNGFNVAARFRIDESVIAYNTYLPGSYLVEPDGGLGDGPIASQLGASYRVDVSSNVVDGASTEFLYTPSDSKGWRAGFFWHMRDSHEMTLVSNNQATCTGDKAGDGEALVFDDNGNSYALENAQTVLGSTSNTVTLPGPLRTKPGLATVDVATYYVGDWLSIIAGKGLGQARRVVSYVVDQASSNVTFTVSPQWDVKPAGGSSRAAVARSVWQVYVVDNVVDHRQPLCLKSNRYRPKGGSIAYYSRTSDSILEGNRQFDTDGLVLDTLYSAIDSACPTCSSIARQQMFVEVRANTIDGEYDWNSDCSSSGITTSVAASPTPSSAPPTLGFGLSIGRNVIRHADGYRGGAISFPRGWFGGPPPSTWKQIDHAVVFKNTLSDMSGPKPTGSCGTYPGQYQTRFGIGVLDPLIWHATLYGNVCQNVTTPLIDAGSATQRVCGGSGGVGLCECP